MENHHTIEQSFGFSHPLQCRPNKFNTRKNTTTISMNTGELLQRQSNRTQTEPKQNICSVCDRVAPWRRVCFILFHVQSSTCFGLLIHNFYTTIYTSRHVILPMDLARQVPKSHLMTETEWRNLGVQQSPGWIHYMLHMPEPHVLLFRRPLPMQPENTATSSMQAV